MGCNVNDNYIVKKRNILLTYFNQLSRQVNRVMNVYRKLVSKKVLSSGLYYLSFMFVYNDDLLSSFPENSTCTSADDLRDLINGSVGNEFVSKDGQ